MSLHFKMAVRLGWLYCLGFFCIICSCTHEDAGTPMDEHYFPKVKAIIENNCVSCHSPGGQGMPIFLTEDTTIAALAASIKAAVLDPPSPRNKRMPLGGELSETDKTLILRWFEKGGKVTD